MGINVKSAKADSADIYEISRKILLNEMENCYTSSDMSVATRVGNINNESYSGPAVYKSFEDSILVRHDGLNEGVNSRIILPTGVLEKEKYKTAGCEALFLGHGKMTGLIENNNYKDSKDYEELGIFLQSMGYTNVENIAGDMLTCVRYQYKVVYQELGIDGRDSEPIDIVKVCVASNLLASEKHTVADFEQGTSIKTISNSGEITYSGSQAQVNGLLIKFKVNAEKDYVIDGVKNPQQHFMDGGVLVEEIETKRPITIKRKVGTFSNELDHGLRLVMSDWTSEQDTENAALSKKYSITDYKESYRTARGYLSDSSEKEEVTDAEKYVLYKKYAVDIYHVTKNGSYCQGEKPSSYISNEGYYYMYYPDQGWCEVIYNTDKKGELVAIFSESEKYKLNTFVSLDGLMEAIFKLDLDEVEISDIEKKMGESVDLTPPEKKLCFSIAESIGWFVCPLLTDLADTAKNIYSWVADDFLSIDSAFFDRDSGNTSSVYTVWTIFMSFSNTILVIFLVVVIFSQLTGIGIDNYGIKRILPKLIISAILINLSFLVCQLATELSNILGRALNGMFTDFGANIAIGDINGNHSFLFNALIAAISGGMITTMGATVIEVTMTGGFVAILIPLLCALLTALVAIFFFFVLLGLRKAGVIVLIALSPLAFVCYILPNTKALYKKWYNAFKGLLLLYPICGLMIGGGFFAAKVLASTGGDYFVMFTALMLMVVPFFFVPKLLKKSFSALSNIGITVSGYGKKIGSRLSGDSSKAIKGSRAYKAYQNDWDMRNAYRQGQANTRRAERRIARIKNPRSAEQRMMLAQANKIKKDSRDRDAKAYESQFDTLSKPDMETKIMEAFSGSDEAERLAAINSAERGSMFEQMLNGAFAVDGKYSESELNRLAKVQNGVISGYALKQLSTPKNQRKSFKEYIEGSGDNSLSGWQRSQGVGWASTLDDDTLKFINKNNSNALSMDSMLTAASQTQNEKKLKELNDMISKRSGEITNNTITGKMLQGMSSSTATAIINTVGIEGFRNAWNDTVKAHKQGNINGEVRSMIERGLR